MGTMGGGKKSVCHTLSRADLGLKSAANLNLRLEGNKADVVPVADVKLKVCGHNSWPGAIAACVVRYLFCFALI